MTHHYFDRTKVIFKPLSERKNKLSVLRDFIAINENSRNKSDTFLKTIEESTRHIKNARQKKSSVVLAFGAHTIKNGLGLVLKELIKNGWITHLATNGAGIIHDWEFAYQGKSSEDVRANVTRGEFGTWHETGFYLNLALVVGAFQGKGYGESIGAMIYKDGLQIPSPGELKDFSMEKMDTNPGEAAAALDLLAVIKKFNLTPGWLEVKHPYKKYSIQAAAFNQKVPFTGHPMFGHDIIYTHPMNHGAAVGRTALRDFLAYANSINHLDGGVYLSIGSAVMSPMIFEKSLSMAQNVHIQKGQHIDNHFMVIVDLAADTWDWEKSGEPPMDNPAYYLRYCKTFNRMGGTMRYLSADNRDFLLALSQSLSK